CLSRSSYAARAKSLLQLNLAVSTLPVSRISLRKLTTDLTLTPHCSAASVIVVPPSIVSTTRLRKSAEYGFAMPAGLLPAGSLNHIRPAMGIPDSAFSGNALVSGLGHSQRF